MWPLWHGCFILDTFDQPSTFSMFSDTDIALINIDDSLVVLNKLDEE
jgi:hypothetical protein